MVLQPLSPPRSAAICRRLETGQKRKRKEKKKKKTRKRTLTPVGCAVERFRPCIHRHLFESRGGAKIRELDNALLRDQNVRTWKKVHTKKRRKAQEGRTAQPHTGKTVPRLGEASMRAKVDVPDNVRE
jgi:hypothetical protein